MKNFSPIFEAAKSVIEDRTDLYPGPVNGECTFKCAENLQDLATSYTEVGEGGDMYENYEEVVSAWRAVYGIEI